MRFIKFFFKGQKEKKSNFEKKEENVFDKNPFKASAKISINNVFMGICFTLLGLITVLASDEVVRKNPILIIQFVFSIPLLYVSNLCYAKAGYREKAEYWDNFAWITGNTALAFILNIIGVLVFLLGFPALSILYFVFLWILLLSYTVINFITDKTRIGLKIFKFLYFIVIQAIFGLALPNIKMS